MLLSYYELKELVKNGVIQNVDESQINGTSIDISLGNMILIERDTRLDYGSSRVIDYRKRQQLFVIEELISEEEGYVLAPGEFILGCTKEIFNLPRWLACQLQLKSSVARIGIENLMAGWCDPGWHGSAMTLELKNALQFHSIRLRPGDRIGQVIFSRCHFVPEERSYSKVGRYNNDKTVSGIKP